MGLNIVSAEISVGVKKGDWIEYHVTTTGTPEEGHDVTWARMEIMELTGTEITVNITTRARNGTYWSDIDIFNPADGNVGVWFLIPANLNLYESFYDASLERKVMIEGSEERPIAGVMRTVTHSSTPERIKSWDKATGVFVETVDVLPNTTLYAIADRTNLWGAQAAEVNPPASFYVVLAVAAVEAGLVVVLALAHVRLRMKPRKPE